jgi:AcrR family transcriptional regulator
MAVRMPHMHNADPDNPQDRSISPRPTPYRPRGSVRRPEILATAIELLAERGLWTLRVVDVAKRAGISPATVIYYFGTKQQLFEQAISDADADFYARLWPELEGIESAIERIACLIERSSRSEWILWLDMWAYSRRHPEMLVAERGFHDRWCTTIADVVRYGQRRGEFGEADPQGVALRLASLTNGLAVHMVLESHDREQYIEMSIRSAALELGCDLDALREAIAQIRQGAPPAGA